MNSLLPLQEQIFDYLNCDNVFNMKMIAKSSEWTQNHNKKQDNGERVVVVQSDDDSVKLNLLYPLTKKMNAKEINTFEYIVKLMTSSECHLKRYLADR